MNECKLVYVINALDTGGAEVGMCRLLDGLDDARYEVTIVTLDGYDEEFVDRRVPRVETIIDCQRLASVRGVSRLVSVLIDADVVVGSLFHSVLVARLVGVINRKAVVITWQHNERFKTDFRRRLFGATLPLSDVLIADSEPVAAMLREEFDLPAGRVETVPIAGISLNAFDPRTHRETDTVTVGSVGVISEQKNFHRVVEMANELSEENIEFRIAGDGPKRSELESRVESLGLENVEFLGTVRDLPTFLNSVDVYVQPSRFEGLCITVVEAMAAGLPIVASAVGGIEYNVDDGTTGYLHDPDDVEGFCDSVRKLAADPAKRRRFGDRGRQLVENRYTQEVLVEEFERALHGESTCG